jgi:multiple sugar transport system permease protein
MVIALLWKWFLDGTYGPFVYFISKIGITDIHFFGEKLALATLVFTNVWRTVPFAMVMLLASLQTIPLEIYESARTDGANAFQVFWKITFPFTIATLLITIIMITLESFNMVTLIFTLTSGGPMGKTETLSLSVYKEAFKNWRLDFATTTGVVILFFNVIFSLGYIALLRRERD